MLPIKVCTRLFVEQAVMPFADAISEDELLATLPPYAGPWYEELVTRQVVYLRARRRGLKLLLPYAYLSDPLPGLVKRLPSCIELDCGRVSAEELLAIQARARTPRRERFREYLTYLRRVDLPGLVARAGNDFDADVYAWYEPNQARSYGRVRPLGADASCSGVVLELHTHPPGVEGFSKIDDEDETGLRIYVVLVDPDSPTPIVLARVSVFGRRIPIPAAWVFDLPEGWRDPLGRACEQIKGGVDGRDEAANTLALLRVSQLEVSDAN
jgi:hypothetical protein